MPLRNRVDPFGAVQAVAERGLFTGNRGIIHDPRTRTLTARRWSTKAWLICRCEYRKRRRDVMGHNGHGGGAGWTELFFLDEVTALAAGHRPCFFCRRESAKPFLALFADVTGITEPRAADLDARLHHERLASGGILRQVEPNALRDLPDGTMVASGERAFAVHSCRLREWSFGGYAAPLSEAIGNKTWQVLTPPTIVGVLRAGYAAVWHPSIAAA